MNVRGPKNRASVRDGTAALSFGEIADVLRERHGWSISNVRVQQLCSRAERKLKIGLSKWYEATYRPED